MTNDIQEKQPIDFYQSQPELYQVRNGTVISKETNRIVATYPALNPYAITPERSKEFQTIRRAQKARSTLQGLADMAKKHGANIGDVDSLTDEELIAAGGDAVRLLTAHMAGQFMDSKNIRGLAESFSKLVDSLSEEPRGRIQPEALPPGTVSASVETLLELASLIEGEQARRLDAARATNGVVSQDAETWANGGN